MGTTFEQGLIPDDLKDEVEFAYLAYQVFVYMDLAKQKFGHAVSERIRTYFLLLAGFDPELKAGLLRLLETIRAAGAEFTAGRFSDLFEGPSRDLSRYYATVAILLLIAKGCPEQRQRVLAGSIAGCLLTARFQADKVFESELASASEVSSTFQWSTEPGPFERQLRRQQGNPLWPSAMRMVSDQQVTDARLADLRRVSDFLSTYRAIERDALSPRANMAVKDASDLEKKIIDLIPSCVILGEYFAKEEKFLADVSASIDQELTRITKESGLRDTYKRYMALARCEGYILTIGVALPSGQETEDYGLRTILSEECEVIRIYAKACKNAGVLGANPLDSAQQVMAEAIREGMDPVLGKRKIDAFRLRLEASEPKSESGIWAGIKRFVRRS